MNLSQPGGSLTGSISQGREVTTVPHFDATSNGLATQKLNSDDLAAIPTSAYLLG